MNLPLLNIRPSPKEGESWAGYLLRLTDENMLAGIGRIGKLLGLTTTQLLTEAPCAVLHQLDIPISQTIAARPRDVPWSRYRSYRSRVCPHCLAEDAQPFIRAAWELPLTISCERHDVLLIDQCSTCRNEIDMRRPSVNRCECGSSFSDQRARSAGTWPETLKWAFAEASRDGAVETFACATPNEMDALRTCRWLVTPFDSEGRQRLRRWDQEEFLTLSEAEALEPLLLDWPRRAADAVAMEVDYSRRKGFNRVSACLHVELFAAMRDVTSELMSRVNWQDKRFPTRRARIGPQKPTTRIKAS